MHIEIAERLKPYIHLPGTYMVLPGSRYRLRIFPAAIELDDLASPTPQALCKITFQLSSDGPFDEFTVQQDLERGEICVWGKNSKAFLRYRISPQKNDDTIVLSFEKIPGSAISVICQGEWSAGSCQAAAGEGVFIGKKRFAKISPSPKPELEMFNIDRLSLGSHKGQDWELMRRRLDFSEIFPIWHRLGQQVGKILPLVEGANRSLLGECQEAIKSNAPETILPAFKRLFLAGFDAALSPRLIDADNHGMGIPVINDAQDSSPLVLLQQGSKLIRSLFIQERGDVVDVLPALPPEFHAGRLLQVECTKGLLSIEWSKKSIRRMEFYALKSGLQHFHFASHEKNFRIRTSTHDRGVSQSTGASINVIPNQHYWFDNFMR